MRKTLLLSLLLLLWCGLQKGNTFDVLLSFSASDGYRTLFYKDESNPILTVSEVLQFKVSDFHFGVSFTTYSGIGISLPNYISLETLNLSPYVYIDLGDFFVLADISLYSGKDSRTSVDTVVSYSFKLNDFFLIETSLSGKYNFETLNSAGGSLLGFKGLVLEGAVSPSLSFPLPMLVNISGKSSFVGAFGEFPSIAPAIYPPVSSISGSFNGVVGVDFILKGDVWISEDITLSLSGGYFLSLNDRFRDYTHIKGEVVFFIYR